MNLRKIISDIEKTDSSIYDTKSGRRDVLKNFGAKVAVASIPVAISSLFNKANAKTTTNSVVNTLNYLLELEYFEYNFFRTANQTGGLIPNADKAGFYSIEKHELAHINTLISTITNLGGTPFTPKYYNNNPYCPAAYDFTVNGQFLIYTMGNYYLFLDLAQVIEDLFSRAYIGAIPSLLGDKDTLTLVMQLHSVEGRHASHVRLVRRFTTTAPDYPKPWITNDISLNYYPVNSFQGYYAGENNVIQNKLDITTFQGISGTISQTAATEAFDEPLDQPTVLNLIAPFLLT